MFAAGGLSGIDGETPVATRGREVKRLLVTAITALLMSLGSAWAGPFEDGAAAYKRGDYASAVRIFESLATQGNAAAQYNLGFMYDSGKGVAQDYAEALKWYRLAVAQGVAEAQQRLGVMYANGRGVTQDYAEALKWYRLAAAQNNALAQFHLGFVRHRDRRRTTPRRSGGTGSLRGAGDAIAHRWLPVRQRQRRPAGFQGSALVVSLGGSAGKCAGAIQPRRDV
jgi:TPR repeat protein